MELYPAFITLTGKKCLVVGAGRRALRSAQRLTRCGAEVHLVSAKAPDNVPGVATLLRRDFTPKDLDNCWIVIAASADRQLNIEIARTCEQQQILCNLPERDGSAGFLMPTIVDRSPLLIAITSGGASPILARALKSKLESLIPTAYARLASIVSQHRAEVKQKLPSKAGRAQFWHNLINGSVGELAFNANAESLEQSIEDAVRSIDKNDENPRIKGHVALVGAGPGDPDLLTFRALRLIQSADVIVYDRLVSKTILDLCRNDAEFVYAGKAKADHAIPQDSINQLLVDLANKGSNVVRLKGGDPFIFGRGGEEIETLADNQITFQVVPGITAAAGCAAFGGIPLTHRDHAQSCVFVTGHLRNGEINLNWTDLQDPTQTIVVYMGLTGLSTICATLIEHGRSMHTPAALIEQGTTPRQRVLTGNLATLPALVNSSDVSAPTLLIIGSVVDLREKLKWFEGQTNSDLTIV